MKAEVGKLDISKFINVLTSSNNLKTAPVDLKKLSHEVDNVVVENAKFNTLQTKVNNLGKNPDATTLSHINQYNTDLNLEEKTKFREKNW